MKVQHRWPGESRFHGWLYILPGLLIYLVFILYPIIETFRTSFYQWDGFSSNRAFVLFDNYIKLLSDQQFIKALLNNLTFIIFYSIIPIIIGLFLASLLGRKPLPGLTFFRTGLFLPQILSMVVVGVMWRWIFNPAFGPLRKASLAVLQGPYKLVRYLGYKYYSDNYEFYDLENDPDELRNLYPDHPASQELKAVLDQRPEPADHRHQVMLEGLPAVPRHDRMHVAPHLPQFGVTRVIPSLRQAEDRFVSAVRARMQRRRPESRPIVPPRRPHLHPDRLAVGGALRVRDAREIPDRLLHAGHAHDVAVELVPDHLVGALRRRDGNGAAGFN
mgnify:CR=1 FL=1